MKLGGNLFKIKPEKLDIWKSWCNELNTILKSEAVETLEEEGNIQEAFLLFKLNNDFYTIGLGEGQNLPATPREINMKHKQIGYECLEHISKIEVLYHLKIESKDN